MTSVAETEDDSRSGADWEGLYQSLRPNLIRALVAATGAYEGTEDAVQDAFARALRTDPGQISNVEGWLFTVALNCLRRSRRRSRLFRPFKRDQISSTRELDAALARNDAVQALQALPERDRTLLVGKYYVGLTQEGLSKALGIPRGTVSAAISRATARLRMMEEDSR
jgi:RNA polymerase sigma-70 factor (ECF subfamily)